MKKLDKISSFVNWYAKHSSITQQLIKLSFKRITTNDLEDESMFAGLINRSLNT